MPVVLVLDPRLSGFVQHLQGEVRDILDRLCSEDPAFESSARLTFSRPPYQIADSHGLPAALTRAAAHCGVATASTGLSFWTDAAVLGAGGTPSVLFGPGGAGLHSLEEYVTVADVLACRDVLATLALDWCSGSAR